MEPTPPFLYRGYVYSYNVFNNENSAVRRVTSVFAAKDLCPVWWQIPGVCVAVSRLYVAPLRLVQIYLRQCNQTEDWSLRQKPNTTVVWTSLWSRGQTVIDQGTIREGEG